jgi:DNA primase
VPNRKQREFLETSTAEYVKALTRDTDAGKYLTEIRGLSADNVRSFRLGYVANPLPGHEQYQGRISVPYVTPSGVTSIRFRRVGDGESPKFLSLPGDPPRLYNTRAFMRPEPYIMVCEGEPDTWTVHQLGYPVVGVPGVSGWRDHFDPAFRGYDAVYILADNDDTGQGLKFAEAVAEKVRNPRIILMPKGHDTNSLYVAEGAEAIRERIGI